MDIMRLVLLHFGIAASMAAGFALWPVVCSTPARIQAIFRRRPGSALVAARRREQLRLLAALHDRRFTNSSH